MEIIEIIKDFANGLLKNATEAAAENEDLSKKREPATPEGQLIAYSALMIMAVLPIILGSIRSDQLHKKKKGSGEKPEAMTKSDAMYFPVIASCALFTLYFFFKFFSKKHINLLLTAYFFVLGVIALAHILSPVFNWLMPGSIPKIPFHIHFSRGQSKQKVVLIDYGFSTHDIVCLVICSGIGVWYLLKKHWIANNMFGLAFSINGVEMLHLNTFVTGAILLSGLFFYDIFWVFGTDVMVTVAKSFEAPVKLVFPQDLLENGFSASNFAMLGLGDIVIPGIFIALLLRFDKNRKLNSRVYFYSTLFAYISGLLTTIFVMHYFKHAQPALLYLVPACLGTPLLVALMRGELTALFAYSDHPEEKADKKNVKENSTTNAKKKDAKKTK